MFDTDNPAGGGTGTNDAGDGGEPTTGAEPRANPTQPQAAPVAGEQGQSQTSQQVQPYAVFPTAEALSVRLERAQKQGASEFLKDLGVEDPEALKGLVKAAREAEEANKSELEKLESRLSKADQAQQALQAERDQLAAQFQTERESRLIERLAGTVGFADVTDATSLVDRGLFEYGDGDDKRVVEVSVKAALEKLLEGKPHLRGGQKPPAPQIDAQAGTGNGPAQPQGARDYSAHLPSRLRRKQQRAAQQQ